VLGRVVVSIKQERVNGYGVHLTAIKCTILL